MLIREVIIGGTSARWHAILYFAAAIALILLAYETLSAQSLSGNGLEFTIGSGYAVLVNQSNTLIRARVKSHAPFIVTSDNDSIRLDASSALPQPQGDYVGEVAIPLGEHRIGVALGSNVTFSLSREAPASVTVVPYDGDDARIMLAVIGLSVVGTLCCAFRSLTARAKFEQVSALCAD